MELIVLTGKNGFFGQTRKPWVSIDTQQCTKYINDFGINVKLKEFHQLVNSDNMPKNSLIFYTFHQKVETRAFINDTAEHLLLCGNTIIPSIEMLRCHENKGYQALLKKRYNCDDLREYYFSSLSELDNYQIDYPIVLKTVAGSNGTGVFLCHSKDDIIKNMRKFQSISTMNKLDLFRRQYLRRKKKFKEYPDYSNKIDYLLYKDYISPELRFVLQEFVPEQNCDYRVLAIADKFFPMKRFTQKGDFRASGTKLFDTDFSIDTDLLDKAFDVRQKLPNTPYLSMDFIFDKRDSKYKILEFQALHFGVSAILKNTGYYSKSTKWEKIDGKKSVEYEFAYGLAKFLKDNY